MYSDWKIETNLSGNDHQPIITSLFPNNQNDPGIKSRPLFYLGKAKWGDYTKDSRNFNLSRPFSCNINKEAANIHKIILQSANCSIPQNRPVNKNPVVPWWSTTLEAMKASRNHLWNKFRRNISTTNEINFKRANAIFKREIKTSKRRALDRLTAEINPSTPSTKMWTNIRRLCGLGMKTPIHCIQTSDSSQNSTTDSQTIANMFCDYWSNESKDSNFSTVFRRNKQRTVSCQKFFVQNKTSTIIENRINFTELSISLNQLKGNTPGIDRISYPMIKNLHKDVLDRLLKFFNVILENFVPQVYKTSLIIPILKTGGTRTNVSSYRLFPLTPVALRYWTKS